MTGVPNLVLCASGLLALPSCLAVGILDGRYNAELSKTAKQMKPRLLGRSYPDILGCMGIPDHTAQNGTTLYVSYTVTSRFGDNGLGQKTEFACKATFEFSDNHVSGVALRGTTDGKDTPDYFPECAYALRQCVPDAKFPSF